MRQGDLKLIDTNEPHSEYRIFDSLSDVIDSFQSCASEWGKYFLTRDHLSGGAWIGRQFRSEHDVLEAVNARWDQGLEWIDDMRDKVRSAITVKPVSRKRRRRWCEDDGDEICTDRLRSGQPYWRRSSRTSARGSSVFTVVCQNNALSDVASRDLIWRGAAAIILTELLEAAGFRVELWGATYSQNSWAIGGTALIATRLKEARQPLDMIPVVNAVSGWYSRTMGFATRFMGNAQARKMGRCGFTATMTPEHLDVFCKEPRVLIDGVYDFRSAVEKINSVIQDLEGFNQ